MGPDGDDTRRIIPVMKTARRMEIVTTRVADAYDVIMHAWDGREHQTTLRMHGVSEQEVQALLTTAQAFGEKRRVKVDAYFKTGPTTLTPFRLQ